MLRLSDDLRILAANRALGALVGRDPAALTGQLLDTILSGAARILFQTHVYPALTANGRVEEVFLTLVSADGQSVPVLFNATRAPSGEEPGIDALVVRIPSRARWEQELLAAARALEQERAAGQRLAEDLSAAAADLSARYAEEQRNREFREALIGVVSHELRTPITTIFGLAHLLRQRAARRGDAELAAQLADVQLEAERMRRLTEDLLVMSRAESGRIDVEQEPLRLEHILRKVIATEQAHAPTHQFSVEAAAGLPLALGEELYVEQVTGNLASNAAKYSPAGTRIVILAAEEQGGVAVRVIDEGPGFGGQEPAQLFELFYRAPDARHRASGAGIGLYVCRELVSAMGGRIWARENSPPPGAEFGFWLPASTD